MYIVSQLDINHLKRAMIMKIVFDARWINTHSPDGITRYSRELIKEMSKSSDSLTLLISSEKQLVGLPKLKYVVTNTPKHPSEIGQARRLNTHGFDVVYSPHFLFGGKGRNFKLIRTVLDLIPFHHKNKQSSLIWKLFHSNMYFLKRLINDSDGLVTISETVKKQLQVHTKLEIAVIHCAPTKLHSMRKSEPTKELLYIGRYEPYKNVETLLRAMQLLPDYTLLLAGNCPEERKKTLSTIIKNKDQVKFLGIISDEEYQVKLNSVFAMVSASKEEGFGLQLIEAMSVGCPVVCSDIAIFKEIVGNSGYFFQSSDTEGLAKSVRKLEDTKRWQQLSAKSQKTAQKYNWQQSARSLSQFCKKLVG